MSDPYEDGLRLLSRRPLTRREVAERLRARGYGEADVEAAVARLIAIAVIDDGALARNWIATSAAARGRGRARALSELTARGVDEAAASAAWAFSVEDGVIDARALLARAVRKRLGAKAAPAEPARLARMYNALIAEGFDESMVDAALAPYGFERNEG